MRLQRFMAIEFEPEIDGYAVTIPTVNLERSIPGRSTLIARLDRSIILRDDDLEDRSILNSTFEALAREYAGCREGRTEALLCHASLIALWFLRCASRREADRCSYARPQVALVRRFLALVEEKYREQLPLSFYAREFGVTVPHLSRMCRRHLGLSALAVVHERVVLKRNEIWRTRQRRSFISPKISASMTLPISRSSSPSTWAKPRQLFEARLLTRPVLSRHEKHPGTDP